MYTVLIQSKKTMDWLQQFYPIFSEAVEQGRVGICQWVEGGMTVETAVPELYDKVSHKRIWRAVIVCGEHDEPDTKYPADSLNPFDFLENKDREGLTIEDGRLIDCQAPLIRLTHLLGGIPTPEPEFEPYVVNEENRVPKVEYRPMNNEETEARKAAYAAWSETHRFHGLPPAEIILVKVRRPVSVSDSLAQVRAAWQVHTEADSSKFWKRNLYPHNCRFLVYDMEQRGVLQRQQDMFKLWTAILLMAENNMDPNVLQAHRLYRLQLHLSENKLARRFQQTVNRLNMARYQLEKSIAKDEQAYMAVDARIPDYEVGIPIAFQLPKVSDIHFDASAFGLTGGVGSKDMAVWEAYSRKARDELQMLIQTTERTLDHAAGRLREHSTYTEHEVESLSVYQEEDMRAALGKTYKDILEEQAYLPMHISDVQNRVNEMNGRVREEILRRMSGGQAVAAVLTAVLALLVCLAPGLLSEATRKGTALWMGGSAAVLTLCGLLILRMQREAFVQKAKQFQISFQTVLAELAHNASAYSQFLSSIASHIHGCNYLDIMGQKRRKRDSSYYFKQTHLKSIDALIGKLSLWASALHVELDLRSVDAIELAEDGDGGIDFDALYAFGGSNTYAVPVNETGVTISSPFEYVEQICIEREEVYDDVRID